MIIVNDIDGFNNILQCVRRLPIQLSNDFLSLQKCFFYIHDNKETSINQYWEIPITSDICLKYTTY